MDKSGAGGGVDDATAAGGVRAAEAVPDDAVGIGCTIGTGAALDGDGAAGVG